MNMIVLSYVYIFTCILRRELSKSPIDIDIACAVARVQ